jgi:hypothetical protein
VFDFIRKSTLWEAWDDGLDREIGELPTFQLKSMQDLVVYRLLRGTRGKTIAEIGAGHSRVLPALAKQNSCVAVERFEGKGGGPTRGQSLPGVRTVAAYLGENDPALPDEAFDVVFSISVVEHVSGRKALAAFHDDQLRVLAPGGVFVHAIDLYLEMEPARPQAARFEIYRDWVTSTPRAEPVGEVYTGPCRFSTDLATNPDNVMHMWGKVSSKLTELRQQAQCVSVIVAGRKLAGAAA